MELDHIFLFVPSKEHAIGMMARDGLSINYGRKHPGQGTENVCACLDDIFLELLWLDGTAISPESEAIGLGARGRGDALPLGIAWRGQAPFATTPYRPPYMPPDRPIPVATDSLDPAMPLVFASPEGTAPADRTDGLAGIRQTPGLATLGQCRLRIPRASAARPLLAPFGRFELEDGPIRLEMRLLSPDGKIARTIVWGASE